jgi:flagellar basal-body rod protein FlgB
MKVELFKTENAQVLKRALDVYQKQHEAIARNVSNINTVGYQPVNTDFSTQLEIASSQSNIKTSDPRHIAGSNFEARTADPESGAAEKVDLSAEMTKLAENQIRYEFATRALNKFYTGIYTAITGKSN